MASPARRAPHSDKHPGAGCAKVGVLLALGTVVALALADGESGVVAVVVVLAGSAIVGRAALKARAEQETRRIRSIQSTEVARYHTMDPGQFEHAVAFLCERDGCRDVRVAGGAGDLGADVLATAPDGRCIVIQCKRYSPTHKVGSQDVQRFGGTCWSVHGAQVAAVVTTSTFTRPAAEYASRSGIRCIDSAALGGWASRTGPPPWA